MKILLINTNPVVSRLLALCTRNEHMVLHEVQSVESVKKVEYDILFVDETSYLSYLSGLFEGLDIRKKVFLSYSADFMQGFDETVKKPFLPSQIIKIITDAGIAKAADNRVEEKIEENSISLFPFSTEEKIEEESFMISSPSMKDVEVDDRLDTLLKSGTKVLSMNEIERIKALLDMEDDEIDIDEDELLEEDVYEARKIKVIKEQLIADGLEIIEEDEMVEALSASVEKASEKLDKKLKKIKKRHKKKTALGEDGRFDLEVALRMVIANLKPKKIKQFLNGEEIKVKVKLEDHR